MISQAGGLLKFYLRATEKGPTFPPGLYRFRIYSFTTFCAW